MKPAATTVQPVPTPDAPKINSASTRRVQKNSPAGERSSKIRVDAGTADSHIAEQRASEDRATPADAGSARPAKADQSKADQSKADQSKADQSKADQSKADQSKADQSKADRSVPSARLSGYQAEAAKLLAGMSPARRKRRAAAEKAKKSHNED